MHHKIIIKMYYYLCIFVMLFHNSIGLIQSEGLVKGLLFDI